VEAGSREENASNLKRPLPAAIDAAEPVPHLRWADYNAPADSRAGRLFDA